MERFGYDFNQKLALAQVSAYCGEKRRAGKGLLPYVSQL